MKRNYFSITVLNQTTNITKAIYSNKSKLFHAIDDCMKFYHYTEATFVNVFNYDKSKKVNYNNITALLRVLLVDESFVIKLSNENESILLEITKLTMNKERLLI